MSETNPNTHSVWNGEEADLYSLLLSELAAILRIDERAIDPAMLFAEYGLDSIDAVIATDAIGARLGIELAPEFLLQNCNLQAAVAALSGNCDDLKQAPLSPVFLFAGAAGRDGALSRVVSRCPSDILFAPVTFGSWRDWVDQGIDFSGLVDQVCEQIERQGPIGQLRLAGFSQGGQLAFAAALRLLQRGRSIQSLILFDTYLDYLPLFVPDRRSPLRRLLGKTATLVRILGRGALLIIGRPVQTSPRSGLGRIRLILSWYQRRRSSPRARRWLLGFSRRWGKILFTGRGGAALDSALQTQIFYEMWRDWTGKTQSGRHLPIPTYLFRSNSPGESNLGWGRYCAPLEVIQVAGDHVSMSDAEHLDALAIQFAVVLRKAEGGDS